MPIFKLALPGRGAGFRAPPQRAPSSPIHRMLGSSAARVALPGLLAALTGQATAEGIDPTHGPSSLRLSGFATLGVAHVEDAAPWQFRRDVIQPTAASGTTHTRTDSRLGFQANWTISPQWEAVGQLVLKPRAANAPASENIEWALLAWRPQPDLTLRFGRISNDSRLISEYTNVGFAYPWVRPPVELYGWEALQRIDGVDLLKTWRQGNATWAGKVQLGGTQVQASALDQPITLRGRDGLMVSLQRRDDVLLLKASYARLRAALTDGGFLTEPLTGPLRTLQALPVEPVRSDAALYARQLSPAFTGHYLSLGLQYEHGPWLLQAEGVGGGTPQQKDLRAFVGLAWRAGATTWYTIWARSLPMDDPVPAANWQAALTPLLGAAAAAQAQQLGLQLAEASNLQRRDQSTVSLGLRWDLHPQVALKSQWDRVHVARYGSALWDRADSQPRRPNIYSLTLDCIF